MARQIVSHRDSLFSTLPDGQDLEAVFQQGFPPGTMDIENNSLKFLKLLDQDLDYEGVTTADTLSLPSDSGLTLLHLSASLGFNNLLDDLIARGAALDRQDNNGNTPLHVAALYGQPTCARILVDNHADVNIVDIQGRSPREVALHCNHSVIAEMMGGGSTELLSSDAGGIVESSKDASSSFPSSTKHSVISRLKTTVKGLIRSKKSGTARPMACPTTESTSPSFPSIVQEVNYPNDNENDTSETSHPTINPPSPPTLSSGLVDDAHNSIVALRRTTNEPPYESHRERAPVSILHPKHRHAIEPETAGPVPRQARHVLTSLIYLSTHLGFHKLASENRPLGKKRLSC